MAQKPEARKSFDQAANAQKTEKVKLRFSQPKDSPQILAYYKENAHQHVHIRDPKWITDHVGKGQFLILENEDGEIIASSATYDYVTEADTDGRPSFFEIGSTNFSPEGNGFGLYPLFIASQVIEAFLNYPPKDKFIANVYDSSPVGRKMLVPKVGWKVIEPSEDVLKKFKSTKSAEHTNEEPMTWYGSPSECLPHQARVVLDFIENGTITHKSGERAVEIDFSEFSLANELKPLLQEIAHGKFSEVLERSAGLEPGLANSRQLLALGTKAGRQFKPN